MTTTLYGHAVHIPQLLNLADHTYVTSSDGLVWPCWGGSTGGSIITTGLGNSAAANCDSIPLRLAGIIYAITGVCHQTANRILLPSGKNVIAARGAWASYITYGILGMDLPGGLPGVCPIFLAKAAVCALANPKTAHLKAKASGSSDSSGDEETSLIKDIISLHEEATPNLYMELKGEAGFNENAELSSKISEGETNIMVKHRLGAGYDTTKTGQLVDLRTELTKDTKDCIASIVAADSTADSLAQTMNDELRKTLVKMKEVLGENDYEKFFGHSDTDIKVVDPEILAKSFESRPKE